MADWAEARPLRMGARGRTCRDLWDAAPKGGWLLDYAAAAGAPRPALVHAAAACARPALRFVREGEDRPRLAVEAAEAWADHPTERNRQRAEKAALAAWKAGATGAALWGAEGAEAGKRAAGEAAAAAAAPAEWVAGGAAGAEVAAWRAAWAHYEAEGPDSRAAAHAACADEVRRLVPFIDLAGSG